MSDTPSRPVEHDEDAAPIEQAERAKAIEDVEQTDTIVEQPDKPEGPIAAAIIAGGIGAAALGLVTTLAEASTRVKDAMEWSTAVGPLSGKTTVAVIVWVVAWAILHVALRNSPYETRRAFIVAVVLIALGAVGTFPTFFEAFA